MRRIAVVSIALCSLSLAACRDGGPQVNTPPVTQQFIAPDKIMIANASNKKIEDVVIETTKGEVLWEGDLIGSQEMAFQFTPRTSGHFIVKYDQANKQPQEVHKGYYTAKGGLIHTFTFDGNGTVDQKTKRNLALD